MVKDLRTRPITLKVGKLNQLTPDEESKWGLYQTQTFLPSLETLFKTESLQTTPSYGIKVSDPIQKVVSPSTIQTASGKTVEIHRKTTAILNAFRWMRGDYGSLGLPLPSEAASAAASKLQSPHTAAYVGALSSVVLSESDCPHFPKVYGIYCGMARKHAVDISDDYEDLADRPWFIQNIGKTFELTLRQEIASPSFSHTRGQRVAIETGEEIALDGIETLDADHADGAVPGMVEEELSGAGTEYESDEEDDTESTESADDLYAIESCDCSSQGSFVEDETGEDPEPFAWAELSNIPVVATIMEQCSGTFYQLLASDPNPEHHLAYLAQVVFALSYAQRVFGFTHNDLHGNNVMYVPTTQEYLNYTLEGVCYRVPTHGHLIKLIDFDRAILNVRLQGQREPRTFMSDQFGEYEEASGQYNTEPFYNPKVPEYKANPSFDLVRLATSMFWELFPEGPEGDSRSPLKAIFLRWMTLPDQTSVLFGKQNPKHDRYHGFMQYKAIARYCKDVVPRKEPWLWHFKTEKLPIGETPIVIEQ